MNQVTQSFASAALRHLTDAAHLLSNALHLSADQTYHLAGFGPECARKACVGSRAWGKVLGHDLGDASDQALEWMIALDPMLSRDRLTGWTIEEPALGEWAPEVRYLPTGTFDDQRSRQLLQACERLTSRTLAGLWADGRLGAPR